MKKNSRNITEEKRTFSFTKAERLTSKKVIDKLFSEGDSFLVFPLKVIFYKTELPNKYPVQVAFSVGKRNFKLAVHRNLIKRKIREVYRLNKHQLYNSLEDTQIALFFIYIGKDIPNYKLIETAMKKGIKKLISEISADNKN